MAKEDEERSEEGLGEGEHDHSDGEGAGEMAAGRGDEGPEEKGEDQDEIDAAGGAVGELDDGGDGRVMLDDGAVAERPVVAAAGAGACGADGGAPDDDGDVIGEDTPGEAAQSRGWAGGGDGGGSSGGHANIRRFILVRENGRRARLPVWGRMTGWR